MNLGHWFAATLIVALIASAFFHAVDGAFAAFVLFCVLHLMRSMR